MDFFEDREGLRHDIKERDPRLIKIFKEAEQETLQELSKRSNVRAKLGTVQKVPVHREWGGTKRTVPLYSEMPRV